MPSASPPPVMLVILDGWGWRAPADDNAVTLARTPAFDALWAAGPHAFLRTSGADVGLPDGQMGNSEVGHLNLGAGRVVRQMLPRIDAAVADGSIAELPALRTLIERLRESRGTCHLLGLLSANGVHSFLPHAAALVAALDSAGVPVAVHALTDGRDGPPRAAAADLDAFAAAAGGRPGMRIATVIGRYWALDRDHRWERVRHAYDAMVDARGMDGAHAPDPQAVVAAAHAADAHVSDEFIPATVIGDYAGMRDGDGLLCFNFRADRVRQILAALLDPGFDGFARARVPQLVAAVGMTEYSQALNERLATLFPPQPLRELLGQVVAAAGLRQMRLAETEKYPHVTYFLNGGEETPLPGEERVMVPSPKVATYDRRPEMSAAELTDRAVAAIAAGGHALLVLNFANPDMVGHTGSLPATIRAVEATDAGLGRIAAAMRAAGGALLVTADHGNAEQMRDPATGQPHTAHTTNPVPVLLAGGPVGARLRDGRLADVAPTLLALLGLPQPAAMTGRSLLAPSDGAAAAG